MNDGAALNPKLEQIESLDPDKAPDHQALVDLVRDDDEEVRYRAVERIGLNQSRGTTDLIVGSLNDPDELVRVQCLEELGCRNDLTAFDIERIWLYLDDESELVRRYAADALAFAGEILVIPLLKERLARVSTAEQASCCFALVELGERSYLERALELLGADCYSTRCFIANNIQRFIDDDNRDRIVAALVRALAAEPTRAAARSIEGTLKEIRGR